MKKRLFVVLIGLFSMFCCIFGLASCGGADGANSQVSTDAKYEYYGNYSFNKNTSSGLIELDLRLDTNNKYTLEFKMTAYDGVYFLTEVGGYEMKSLDEPIQDEKMEALYMLVFKPTETTGYDGDVVNTGRGYITEHYFKNIWWCYANTVQKGATVVWGNTETAYAMEYSKLRYTITYLAEEGGSISGMSTQKIEKGGNGQEVTAVPDYGYSFSHWSDGVTTATRQEKQVLENKQITAVFVESLPKYTLTYTASDGGIIEGETSQTLFEGMDGEAVTAVLVGISLDEEIPNPYEFIGWSDGVTTLERKDLNVRQDVNVTAIFRRQFVYSAYVEEGLGEVEISSKVANYANEYTVSATAIPNAGWAFVEWSDGVTTATRTDVLTEDTKVYAIFAKEIKLIAMPGGTITCNGQTGTELTVLLREPMAGELTLYAEAIADNGWEECGWSKDENASKWESHNMFLDLDYYSVKGTYYAIFEKVED